MARRPISGIPEKPQATLQGRGRGAIVDRKAAKDGWKANPGRQGHMTREDRRQWIAERREQAKARARNSDDG